MFKTIPKNEAKKKVLKSFLSISEQDHSDREPRMSSEPTIPDPRQQSDHQHQRPHPPH